MKLPKGFLAAGIRCGIGKSSKEELGLIYSRVPAVAAGVFTKNEVKAAPVLLSRHNLGNGRAQAIVANSGCANACSGQQGKKDALLMAELTAKVLKINPKDVIIASTGVIGHFLPMAKIKTGINKLGAHLRLSTAGPDNSFARAIMTTDTFPKIVSRQFSIGGHKITLTGVAKGAGMICPDMATMLCFLITDLKITAPLLKKSLKSAVNSSFNMLTVDGDMSTNDTVVILANCLAENPIISKQNREFYKFNNCLREVTVDLAKMIARDGEGATKFLEITAKGARSFKEAKKVALTVANSNLVKTAVFGQDPNWGRIMAAVGRAGIEVNPDKIDIYLSTNDEYRKRGPQKVKLVNNGCGANFKENTAKNILRTKKLKIIIDLKQGTQQATVFTCDLSTDYVKINADYLT